jgi:exopolyphosphatase/guanosine-5'-triphosphate,3'-diphosphate pyrophosphatase
MRLAAIDIGSNAARLLICDVTKYKDGSLDYTKVNLVRVPLRLGFDVFESGIISNERKAAFIECMIAFAHLMNVYEVEAYKACATSAMRDAQNSAMVLREVKEKSGLSVRVISGSEEAGVLYDTHLAETMAPGYQYLYIDVGGGSTELTLFRSGNSALKKSFDLGTIRVLKKQIPDWKWDELKQYCKTHIRPLYPVIGIGSGGNINKLFSMSKRKQGRPLPLEELKEWYKEMGAMNVAERMHAYGFREDRADVIVPALQIYISIMRWCEIDRIQVPQVGLADGLIRELYQELTA